MHDEVVEALDAEQQALLEVVAGLDDAGLATASRCAGWSITEVLLHLAQTNELAAASAAGRFSEAVDSGPQVTSAGDVDEWADAAVAAERGESPSAVRDRWIASASAQLDAFRAVDASARVQWVAGELAARTLASTRLAETWIHSNDVTVPLGTAPPPTERLWHIARLAHRTLPHAFARAGDELGSEVAFVLDAPGGGTWTFGDPGAATVVQGPAQELCEVAGQRADAAATSLRASGPDGDRVLALVRTFA